jgi:hypothetical protein
VTARFSVTVTVAPDARVFSKREVPDFELDRVDTLTRGFFPPSLGQVAPNTMRARHDPHLHSRCSGCFGCANVGEDIIVLLYKMASIGHYLPLDGQVDVDCMAHLPHPGDARYALWRDGRPALSVSHAYAYNRGSRQDGQAT